MPRVIVTPTAQADLKQLLRTHSLPSTTRERVRRSVQPLRQHPQLGAPLHGRWAELRFILGPWRWMIVVYHYGPEADVVAIVAIQDGRSATAATTSR